MRSLVPVVAGTAEIPNEGHLPFTNLESLTNEATVKAVPDFFDGAHPETIDKEVGQAMSQMIIPTKHTAVPAVPNFFLEAKASKGGAHVALRQACLDGAYGARAVDALRSYAEAEPAYDGSASAYSSTLHDGTLKLFAHHVTVPRTAQGRPEYHMTQLRSFGMTDSRETFIAGASAFRNARDLAKSDRDSALWVANRRASRAGASAAEEHRTESRAQAVFRRSPVASARPAACKEAHDARGQQVAVDHQGNRAKWAAPDRTDGRASFVSSLVDFYRRYGSLQASQASFWCRLLATSSSSPVQESSATLGCRGTRNSFLRCFGPSSTIPRLGFCASQVALGQASFPWPCSLRRTLTTRCARW